MPVIPQLVRSRAGIWPLACLPLNQAPASTLAAPACSWGWAEKGPKPLGPLSCRLVLCGPLSSLPADSLGGDRKTNQQGWGQRQGEGVALAGQLAEVRAQGRLARDSSPAGRHSGSLTTSGPRSSQALCAPSGRERKPRPACCRLTKSRRKTACHLGPSPWAGDGWPVLSPLRASRVSSSV